MPTSGHSASRATSSETIRSRPKKNSASELSNAASPLNGHSTGLAGASPATVDVESGVLTQDHALELAELRARRQPELVTQ